METNEQYQKHTEIYNDLKRKGYILFETVIGSQAHGTATPQSDVDMAFVYMAPQDWLYVRANYHEHLRLSKDCVGYELEHFLKFIASNNPSSMELLFSPEDCWILRHPLYARLHAAREKFLSKVAQKAYLGYATAQIRKAKGMEKFQNWDADRTKRKEPIDFCWVVLGNQTISLRRFMDAAGELYEWSNLGVTNIEHAPNTFSLFHGKGMRGIFGDNSDQILFSSIPKGQKPIALMVYNQDAYQMHTADWRRYTEWAANTNKNRWVKTDGGDYIDAKNVMHLVRLTQMNREMAEGKGCVVRRPNRDELLAIRGGEKNLQEIIDWSDKEEAEIKELYALSELREKVDVDFATDLLLNMRKDFYLTSQSHHVVSITHYDCKYLQNEPQR